MHKSFNLQVFLLHSPVFFDSRFFGHDKVFIPPYWDSDMSFMYFIKFTGHGIQNNLWRKRELSIRKTLARLKPLITCQCFGIDKTVLIYSTTLYYHFFFKIEITLTECGRNGKHQYWCCVTGAASYSWFSIYILDATAKILSYQINVVAKVN